jgi:hypothetical protein
MGVVGMATLVGVSCFYFLRIIFLTEFYGFRPLIPSNPLCNHIVLLVWEKDVAHHLSQ